MSFGGELYSFFFGVNLAPKFYRGLKKVIRKDLGLVPRALMKEIRHKAKEDLANDKGIVKFPAKVQYRLAVALCAADEVLKNNTSEDDRVELFKKAIFLKYRKTKPGFWFWLLNKVFYGNSRKIRLVYSSAIWKFGLGFSRAEPCPTPREYDLEVDSCFYHDFFSKKNKPHLTKVMCAVDAVWFDTLASKNKYRVLYKKKSRKTLAEGESKCVFKIKVGSIKK